MVTPQEAIKLLCEYYANVTPERFEKDRRRFGVIERRLQNLPWAIVQQGMSAQGAFQIVPSVDCEERDLPSFFGRDAKEFFQKDVPTVVDYFQTREEAEDFLNQFSPPSLQRPSKDNPWPAAIERSLKQWYTELKRTREEKPGHY